MSKAPTKSPALPVRCGWANADPIYVRYHDEEWGVPAYDDRVLFELLILEGAQAGLSWLTILKEREAYRKAFARFDPRKVARYDAAKVAALMADAALRPCGSRRAPVPTARGRASTPTLAFATLTETARPGWPR